MFFVQIRKNRVIAFVLCVVNYTVFLIISVNTRNAPTMKYNKVEH